MTAKKTRLGELIRAVRDSRSENQPEFAESLGVSQGTVSAWEANDKRRRPSVDALFRIGCLAKNPELAISLWEHAGLRHEAILQAARKIFQDDRLTIPPGTEIVRIPRFWETLEGRKEAGRPIPFAAEFIPNPVATICVLSDERSTALVNAPRGTILVDTSCEGVQNLRDLWGHVIMLRYHWDPARLAPRAGEGVYIGRLELVGSQRSHQKLEAAFMDGLLYSLVEGPPWAFIEVGEYNEPEGMKGVPPDDIEGRIKRWADVRRRGLSGFHLYKGVDILGLVIGRLTGQVEK